VPRDPRKVKKHPVQPDPKYGSKLVAKFINKLMRHGKKSLARRLVYTAFDLIEKETKKNPLEVFEKAIENVSPLLIVRPRRVGGATYQIPTEVKPEKRKILAMQWIIAAVRARKGKSTPEKLAEEIIAAFNNTGAAIKKKEDVHKMAEANKAFIHYAKF